MRISLLLATAFSLHTYVSSAAQEPSRGLRAELGIEATHWVFDGGTYSITGQTGWGPTVRFGLRPRTGSRVSALAALAYAAEGSFDPGIAGGAVELAVRFARVGETRRRVNGFLTASLGRFHFDADHQERRLAGCTPSLGCQFEGVTFRSGWRTVISGGLGMDLPVSSTLLLQPQAQILRPIGSATAGPENSSAMLRVGLGLAWR